MSDVQPYERLGAAIVEQACKDAKRYPGEVRRFFCDKRSIFDICMPTADGKAVYEQMMINYQKYGRYAALEVNSNKGQ